MLVLVLLLIIVAISLKYFNENALVTTGNLNAAHRASNSFEQEFSTSTSTTTFWKRITVILLICTLPLIWEGRIYEDIYLYNGLLLLTHKLNLVVWLLLFTGLSLISIIGIQDNVSYLAILGKPESGQNERIVFTLCAILGGIILNSATDILTILLGLELQSYSVYILAASYRNYEPSEAAGLKYFLLGALSSALVFMGLAILYAYSGSTNLDTSFLMVASNVQGSNYLPLEFNFLLPYVGIILIFAGLSWKIAAAPVQAWSIDVYDAVPTRTTAILSLLPKIALFSVILRLITMLTNNNNSIIETTSLQIIILVIALSLIVGSVAGLFQPRIKRLLAYSSVLNVGFILMSTLLSNSTSSASWWLDFYNPTLYIIQYILTTVTIWLCLINLANISYSTTNSISEITLISELQGIHTNFSPTQYKLNYSTTLIAICLSALFLSTAGIPPMVGFYAKYSVILLSLQSGYVSLALISVIASILSTVYYLSIIRAIWSKSSIYTRQSDTIHINSLAFSNNNDVFESTLLISFLTLVIVLYLLQYSVVYVFLSL